MDINFMIVVVEVLLMVVIACFMLYGFRAGKKGFKDGK